TRGDRARQLLGRTLRALQRRPGAVRRGTGDRPRARPAPGPRVARLPLRPDLGLGGQGRGDLRVRGRLTPPLAGPTDRPHEGHHVKILLPTSIPLALELPDGVTAVPYDQRVPV